MALLVVIVCGIGFYMEFGLGWSLLLGVLLIVWCWWLWRFTHRHKRAHKHRPKQVHSQAKQPTRPADNPRPSRRDRVVRRLGERPATKAGR